MKPITFSLLISAVIALVGCSKSQDQSNSSKSIKVATPPMEIQCDLDDAFKKYAGSVLLEFDEDKNTLTLLRSEGKGAIFMDNRNAWIAEAMDVSMSNQSTDQNIISTVANGEFRWEFILNRNEGSLLLKQRKVQMYWEGPCRKIDRGNKF